MYVPASFAETDREVLFDFIEQHGFATVLTCAEQVPTVSHVPLLLDRSERGKERLLGHVAKANDHWRCFDGRSSALAIFHGPHAYISPSWYVTRPSVPTWNYAVVHVHGTVRLVNEAETESIVQRTVKQYEASRAKPWPSEGDLPPDYLRQQLRALVGFEVAIERLEAKFKLSQNRSAADRAGVLAGLEAEPNAQSQALAAFAQKRRTFA